MKEILKMNELDNVIVANTIEEIPLSMINESKIYYSFSVVIGKDVYSVNVFENKTVIYNRGRFLKSNNKFKINRGKNNRIEVINDNELIENIMITFPRYYHM